MVRQSNALGPRNIPSNRITATDDLSGAVGSSEHAEISTITWQVTTLKAGAKVIVEDEDGNNELLEIPLDALTMPVTNRWDPEYVLPDNKKLVATYTGDAGGEVLFSGGYGLTKTARSK